VSLWQHLHRCIQRGQFSKFSVGGELLEFGGREDGFCSVQSWVALKQQAFEVLQLVITAFAAKDSAIEFDRKFAVGEGAIDE
jgi:hypothetical protein